MPPKKSIAPPIDRPLSKAYLREFAGWSTAFPPGLSEPTSLRLMENVMITRGKSAAVRPALRSVLTKDLWLDSNFNLEMVGGFEHFFTNDGQKALLFAARQPAGNVVFRAAVWNPTTDVNHPSYQRYDVKTLVELGFSIPQGEATLNFSSVTTFVKYLQIDNKIFALSDGGEDLRLFDVGTTKAARKVTAITEPEWTTGSAPIVYHPDAAWINGPQTGVATAETPTTQTLISSVAADNDYSYGFFYTFSNEVGEGVSSPITVVKAARSWSQWRFLAPDASGDPTTTPVTDPRKAMDQFYVEIPNTIPNTVYDDATVQGAVRWTLYMFTWSDQDPVPFEALSVATGDMTQKWLQNTAAIDVSTASAPLPTQENRVNYSEPSNASQGLVAGDRLILVNDRENGALIRWSSNQADEYTNFSPSVGGGLKTLSSGNLNIPVAVKLWQNPQSVDTITILCSGVDGYSTAYYMAPASIDGQSSSTQIMGFEETTATPGTVSPYGVEVFNNALYHPLDTELMKSTASNYNISHATQTLDIANKWTELVNKQNIVSSQHESRLYYIVHNPDGAPLEPGCKGNEVWIFDGAKEAGSWSRWLVQGIALSKLQVGDKLYMAVARPEAIFVFDELKITDDVSTGGGTAQRAIPWRLETNTQGANRAHDAWAHLRQVNAVFGNWRGSLRYGIRGLDMNGKKVNLSKVYHRPLLDDLRERPMPFDIEDFLRVGKDMKEWVFWAESYVDPSEVVRASYGQINLVQYRYTPVSVNVGGEFGSVETFEYGRAAAGLATNTDNGVPQSYIDTARP